MFVVTPDTSEQQIAALAQVFSGQFGGMTWELLGPTFEVVGLQKAPITIEGSGMRSQFRAEGVLEARGDSLKNPVTGEDHQAFVDLPSGFIWTRGECGSGSFHARSDDLEISAENSNWILYDFDWSNLAA